MLNPQQKPTRSQFLKLATWFEGSLVLIAYIIGWFTDIDPYRALRLDASTVFFGFLGTAPLYFVFVLTFRSANHALRTIRHFLLDHMGPILASAKGWELGYLALLAGVTEETLFRGVMQPLIETHWGWFAGLILSNVFFALAHAITKMYALLAGLTGIYLGIALDLSGTRDLGIPIAIHAIYDYLAFVAVASAYNANHAREF